MDENALVNFNEINPIDTEYHKTKILIITLRISAVETSIPSRVNKPASAPSVIPTPPGINDMAPKRIEVA